MAKSLGLRHNPEKRLGGPAGSNRGISEIECRGFRDVFLSEDEDVVVVRELEMEILGRGRCLGSSGAVPNRLSANLIWVSSPRAQYIF